MTTWNVDFLRPIGFPAPKLNHAGASCCSCGCPTKHEYALIILNQPFSLPLLQRLWKSSLWHCCADGGANRLYDLLTSLKLDPRTYLPDLIRGDLDSLRSDVREYYASQGVRIVQDHDQDSTDLMKCVYALESKEHDEDRKAFSKGSTLEAQYELIILGGLAGRLDHTIHTLSYLHKLRKTRKRVYAVTDDNVGWVLDSGEHRIYVDHTLLGPTCGLLPVGIDETILSTNGLRWNLTDHPSSFDGLVSTSNHLVSGKDVWLKTSKPIWWTAELRPLVKECDQSTASTATGKTIERITIPSTGLTLPSLSELLSSQYSNTNLAKVLETSQWSVDEEMVDDFSSVTLKGGEEVAVIPPVSGG